VPVGESRTDGSDGSNPGWRCCCNATINATSNCQQQRHPGLEPRTAGSIATAPSLQVGRLPLKLMTVAGGQLLGAWLTRLLFVATINWLTAL
jgi:hypothetical protein